MFKLTTTICLLALAACSHNERPAASSDDGVTPKENEPFDRYGENDKQLDTSSTTQAPMDAPRPLADFDSSEPVTAEPLANETAVAPDNTAVNERDRNANSLTPMDQGSSKSDTDITQQIRQAVVNDATLSFAAKNIKIITTQGKVTLRGPVNSAQERATIEASATRIAGKDRVDNQLEIRN